jgi:hypothetical protein
MVRYRRGRSEPSIPRDELFFYLRTNWKLAMSQFKSRIIRVISYLDIIIFHVIQVAFVAIGIVSLLQCLNNFDELVRDFLCLDKKTSYVP